MISLDSDRIRLRDATNNILVTLFYGMDGKSFDKMVMELEKQT